MTGNIRNISNMPETCETCYYFFIFLGLSRAYLYVSNHHTTIEKTKYADRPSSIHVKFKPFSDIPA